VKVDSSRPNFTTISAGWAHGARKIEKISVADALISSVKVSAVLT